MKRILVAAIAATLVAGPVVAEEAAPVTGPNSHSSCQAWFNDYFGGDEAGDINGLGNKSDYWQQDPENFYVTALFEAMQRLFFRNWVCSNGEGG
jgi:hypothetical protein